MTNDSDWMHPLDQPRTPAPTETHVLRMYDDETRTFTQFMFNSAAAASAWRQTQRVLAPYEQWHQFRTTHIRPLITIFR